MSDTVDHIIGEAGTGCDTANKNNSHLPSHPRKSAHTTQLPTQRFLSEDPNTKVTRRHTGGSPVASLSYKKGTNSEPATPMDRCGKT